MSRGYHAGMDGIGWAVSAMSAAQTRLEIAAENLANGSSDGFRRLVARGSLWSGGVRILAMRDEAQGALRRTGRPFDLAIVGRGAFRLRTADGDVVQTRNGAFSRDRFGALRDDLGRVLLGRNGPLHVAADATAIDVPLPAGSRVRTGFLEASNADSIGEMIDVLAAERSFETAQKVVSAIDQSRQRADAQMAQFK